MNSAQGRSGFLVRRALWAGLCATAVVHAMVQLTSIPLLWHRTDSDRDVLAVYAAGERVRTGEPLYLPWPDYGPHVSTSSGPRFGAKLHLYPPFLATAVAPLTALSFTTFARLWYLPLLAAFWIYAWCLARLVLPRPNAWSVLIAGEALGLTPGAHRAVALGQIDPVLWALFGLALAVPAVRGAAFSASAAVKLYAGWPLLFAIRREGRGVFLQGLTVLLAGVLASGLTLGFGVFLDWAHYVLPIVGQGTFNRDNVSLSFAALRLIRLLGWAYVPGPLPDWARLYLTTVGIGAPLLTGWLTRRGNRNLQYGCVGAAAIMFGPLCWTSYLPILLSPVAVALGLRVRRPVAAG